MFRDLFARFDILEAQRVVLRCFVIDIVVNLLRLVPLGLIGFWLVAAEYLDMRGRMEIVQQEHPKLWRLMNDRPFRLVLLLLVFVMLSEDWRENLQQLESESAPPAFRFTAPQPPQLQQVKSEPMESPDSLRRRTLRTADDVADFLHERAEKHPPYAYPDSGDPNPSDEQKKKIAECQEFDRKTAQYYAEHFRDRMVGIVREYAAKGVRTGTLETDLKNRVPYFALEGSLMEVNGGDELSRFRELGWHVDSHDALVVF